MQNDLQIVISRRIPILFENILGYESGDRESALMEKNKSQKTPASVPLTM
jgi:hypothetical protein